MFNRIHTFMLVFLVVVFYPLLAFAEEVAEAIAAGGTESWQSQLMNTALAIFSMLITLVLVPIAKHYIDKSKLAKQLLTDEVIDKVVAQSVHFAEEKARDAIKRKLDKPDSNEKLDNAVQFVLSQLNSRKIPDKGVDWVKNKVESKLGELRDSTTSNTPDKV